MQSSTAGCGHTESDTQWRKQKPQNRKQHEETLRWPFSERKFTPQTKRKACWGMSEVVSWCLDQEKTFPKDTETLRIGLIPRAEKHRKAKSGRRAEARLGKRKCKGPPLMRIKSIFFRRMLKPLYLLENNSRLKKVLEEQLSTGLQFLFLLLILSRFKFLSF